MKMFFFVINYFHRFFGIFDIFLLQKSKLSQGKHSVTLNLL